jgi:hypothetical protein
LYSMSAYIPTNQTRNTATTMMNFGAPRADRSVTSSPALDADQQTNSGTAEHSATEQSAEIITASRDNNPTTRPEPSNRVNYQRTERSNLIRAASVNSRTANSPRSIASSRAGDSHNSLNGVQAFHPPMLSSLRNR